MSTSGHVQSDGCSNLLTPSACDRLLPLLYSMKKWYANKVSIHLATWLHGSRILRGKLEPGGPTSPKIFYQANNGDYIPQNTELPIILFCVTQKFLSA